MSIHVWTVLYCVYIQMSTITVLMGILVVSFETDHEGKLNVDVTWNVITIKVLLKCMSLWDNNAYYWPRCKHSAVWNNLFLPLCKKFSSQMTERFQMDEKKLIRRALTFAHCSRSNMYTCYLHCYLLKSSIVCTQPIRIECRLPNFIFTDLTGRNKS